MRKLLVAVVCTLVLGALASAANAEKGGHGRGNQTPSPNSSIELAGYDEATRGEAPHLGAAVGFRTVAAGLAGWEYPMVAVWCYQDVNGDGIQLWPNDAGDLVYMQLDQPDAEFVLGGGSSDWRTKGGSADCWANLYAYGNKGNNETIRDLAVTSFWAAG